MESLHYLLMKAHTNLQRNIIAGAAELGLSPGQPKILDYLSRHEGSDQKTIAAYCEIEQTTVGSILTRIPSLLNADATTNLLCFGTDTNLIKTLLLLP